jgi:hypothetical protein
MTPGQPQPPLNLDDPITLARVQLDYEQALPHIKTCARTRFRAIRDHAARKDAIAEVIAIGWEHWLSAISHGNNPTTFIGSIADKAIRRVRADRRLCGQESVDDVLSSRARSRRGFSLESLPGDDQGNVPCDATAPPPDRVAIREQYSMLLDQLGSRKRRIVEDLAAGGETQEVAARYNVTPARISQIRREVEQIWKQLHRGERGR